MYQADLFAPMSNVAAPEATEVGRWSDERMDLDVARDHTLAYHIFLPWPAGCAVVISQSFALR